MKKNSDSLEERKLTSRKFIRAVQYVSKMKAPSVGIVIFGGVAPLPTGSTLIVQNTIEPVNQQTSMCVSVYGSVKE